MPNTTINVQKKYKNTQVVPIYGSPSQLRESCVTQERRAKIRAAVDILRADLDTVPSQVVEVTYQEKVVASCNKEEVQCAACVIL